MAAVETRDRLPEVNELISRGQRGGLYRLCRTLGDGGYGTVFEAMEQHTRRKVAVKVENYSKSMIHIEVGVMRKANAERCQHIAELLDYGTEKHEYVFMVLTLLGPDLTKLRNEQKPRRFSPGTALRVGRSTLEAIQELHEKCGYISRDIKPGNFAIGLAENNAERNFYLIDFGLAKRYRDKNSNIVESRGEIGWRGTSRYGSLQAHLRMDLSRRDDTESWLYMLVELTRGALPWRCIADRPLVQAAKIAARNTHRKEFLEMCPVHYGFILDKIDRLAFEERPQYEEIFELLDDARRHIVESNGTNADDRFDWEQDRVNTARHITTSASDRDQKPSNGSAEPL